MNDVVVPQTRRRPRFVAKPLQLAGIDSGREWQHLQGDAPAE